MNPANDRPSLPLAPRAAALLDGAARVASLGAVCLAAIVLAAMVGLVFVSVVQRNLGGGGLDYAGELAGYGVAALTWGGLAWALREGALIRVSLIGLALRSRPSLDRLQHGLALAATLAVTALAAWYFWISVERHWRRGTVSPTTAEAPMWLAEGVMLAGLVLFMLQLLAMLASLLAGHREGAGETLGAQAGRPDAREG